MNTSLVFSVLLHKTHPLGGCFLARLDDGRFLAGRDETSAKVFEDARAVHEHFHPLAQRGSHWAWNLCYAVEDHIA